MHKSNKERQEQFKQCDFFPDTYKIVIQPPTFKNLSQAFSYFTQHQDEFKNADDGDGDSIPDNVFSPITDVHDSIDYFEDRMREESRRSATKPTSGGESAESAKLFSAQSASEPTRGGEKAESGAAAAAPDIQ